MITIKDMAEIAGSARLLLRMFYMEERKNVEGDIEKVQDVIDQSHYVSNMGHAFWQIMAPELSEVIMNYDRRAENNAMADPFYGTIVGALEKKSGTRLLYDAIYGREC